MAKTTGRRGRPTAVFRPKFGEPVIGLMRLGDGRWRASGPDKFTFSEADEQVAIARFREWQAREINPNLGTAKAHADWSSAFRDVMGRAVAAGGTLKAEIGSPAVNAGLHVVTDETLSPQQWAWLRRMLMDNPRWVAERAGLPKLAFFKELEETKPLPMLEALRKVWDQYFDSSPEQKRKCPQAFDDFCNTTNVKRLEDITPEIVVSFRDAVYARKLAGKSQSNCFTRVRRYLSFFRDRAIVIDDMTRIIGYLALLTPNESTVSLDPKPIEVADWKKLLAAATGDDRAMVLLMLNCAMYLQEITRLKWADIRNGCLVTHRAKTGRCVRVAVLWKSTLRALAAVKMRGPSIFYNYAASPITIKGAELRFRALRDKAGVTVTSSQLRDGAYTAMVSANVTSNLCQLLVGHRSGLSDHYVKRRPQMVAPACEAIAKAYGIK